MDLQGGITHVRGGDFSWPANKVLSVNSQVGTPELWIAGGVANTGPNVGNPLVSALYVGRGGSGKLRVVGAGTSLPMTGTIVVADSSGGAGEIDVDSTATMPVNGNLDIGQGGAGSLYVMNGGQLSAGLANVGVRSSSSGTVWLMNPGSRLSLSQSLWVSGTAGGPSGAAGLSDVIADSSSTLMMTNANPSLATITVYPAGRLTAQNGGVIAAGVISNQGRLVVRTGGQIRDSSSVTNSAAAWIEGQGPIAGGAVTNSGTIAPYGPDSPFGAITIPHGSFTQTSGGHFQTVLGSVGGRRCDTLAVGGPATLAGTLDIFLDPSFVRTPSDTFTILTCTSRTGVFSAVNWNYSTLTGQAQMVYTPTSVMIVIGNGTTGVPSLADPQALRFAAVGPVSRPGFVLELPEASRVEVRLYDVRGRGVAALFDGAMLPGRHQLALPADAELPSGAYFAKAVVRARERTYERTARAILVH
jgi:hypothetical protein